MDGGVSQDVLRQCVAAMVTLEGRLGETLARPLEEVERYLEAPAVLARLRSLAAEQRQALQAHLQQLGESDLPALGSTLAAGFEFGPAAQGETKGRGAVASLRTIALMLDETAVGYTVLHGLAHRSYNIPTADLADQHRRKYLDAIRLVHWAIGDVVVQELRQAGYFCRCPCPLCGAGLCNCSHIHTDSEVTALDPPLGGMVVRQSPVGSKAEQAGLHEGDVIMEVDDRQVRSYEAMREAMNAHQLGEEVRLRVRRAAGDLEQVGITR